MNTRTQKIILITSITLVGGGIGVALLTAGAPSSYRATETITPQASAPALPPSDLKQPPATVILNDSEESPANAGLRAREILRSAPDDRVNKEWRLYQNATYDFTLEYPPAWSVTEIGAQIYFRPPSPARYEVERDPRIALIIKPRADVLGARAGEEAWFDAAVVANAERYDAIKKSINGVTHYRFSEGAGEYPHRQSVVFRGDRVYWFEIQASDTEVHDVFSKLVTTLRFIE